MVLARITNRSALGRVFAIGAILAALIPTFWYDLLGTGVAIDQIDAYLACIPMYGLFTYLTYRLRNRSFKACWTVAVFGLLLALPLLFYVLIGLTWAISGFAP